MYTIRNTVIRLPMMADRKSVRATTQIQNLIMKERKNFAIRSTIADDFFSGGRSVADGGPVAAVVAAPTGSCSGAAILAIIDSRRSVCFSWISWRSEIQNIVVKSDFTRSGTIGYSVRRTNPSCSRLIPEPCEKLEKGNGNFINRVAKIS